MFFVFWIYFNKRKKIHTKNPPRPRSDYSLINYQENLYIFGGNDGSKLLKDLVQLNFCEKLKKKNETLWIKYRFFLK